MNWLDEYNSKLRDAQEAVRLVRSGDRVYYATNTAIFAARVETAPTFRVVGHERVLDLPPGVTAALTRGWYDVSPDGSRFLMARPSQFGDDNQDELVELILVQNFFEELKARVPN